MFQRIEGDAACNSCVASNLHPGLIGETAMVIHGFVEVIIAASGGGLDVTLGSAGDGIHRRS